VRDVARPVQHIDEIVVGINVVQLAGDDQALHDADVACTKLHPAEEPRPFALGDDTQRPFEMIIVDRDIRILSRPPIPILERGCSSRLRSSGCWV
jgi:hypothetical protein